jgi:hypothetical protein
LAIGALSDVFLIRNGLSYSGPTLLDRYPILWPVWLIFIFACTYLIESRRRAAGEESQASYVFGPATAIWLGTMVTHAVLFIRDVTTDPTSHNLWPFEFLFWGLSSRRRPMADRCWRAGFPDAPSSEPVRGNRPTAALRANVRFPSRGECPSFGPQ